MSSKTLRVLYSFPDDIGSAGIGATAWYQVTGLAQEGVEVHVHPTVVVKAIPGAACVQETLRRFGVAIPQSLLGVERALALHDWIVARRLERLQGSVDLIHCWPDASLRTLQVARRLGIPSVLERPCAHTAFAYDIVNAECRREGIRLPQNHCHALRPKRLAHEEREYEWADALLCPSDFVVRTLREREIPLAKLQRHQYGYDPALFSPNGSARRREGRPLSMIFVGRCEPGKGLQYALRAWHNSAAKEQGTFTICGKFLPGFCRKLGPLLNHRSIHITGFTDSVASRMRLSDVLVLPSLVEGSALVAYEARACGCVLLVSDASGAPCEHMKDALVHKVGDVGTLTQHINLMNEDWELYARLREASVATLEQITWQSAARRLVHVYRDVINTRT